MLRQALFALFLALPATAQEMRTYTDALDRTVEIPADPQRIQAMYLGSVTPALIELGAPVVGSPGHLGEDGTPYMRMVDQVMKIDFDNSAIAFTHAGAIDFEAIAAQEPDLIVGLVSNDAEFVDRLERIAPTVLLDDSQPGLDLYRDIADVAGRLDVFEGLLADYEALIEDARGWLGDDDRTYSVLGTWGGDLYVHGNFGALTVVLDDLGFEIVGDGKALQERGSTWDGEILSAETLPDQDADFVFTTFRTDQGPEVSPAATLAQFEEVLPGFCRLLTACAEGRLVILPTEHVGISFRTLDSNIFYVVTNIASRDGIVAD